MKNDIAEKVLFELKLANNPGIFGVIRRIVKGNSENPKEIIQLLKWKRQNYLENFIAKTTKQNETKNSPELIRFLNEVNGKGNFTNNEERFSSLTNCLMNYLCLVVGNTSYRIVDCEIYYMDIEHKDPYAHCSDWQLTAGKLYFNKAGGVGISFGNPNYPAWGGIIIRGIRNIKTNEYIKKITTIVAQIFKSLDYIILCNNRIFLAQLQPGQIKIEEPIQSTRIGLTKKKFDDDNYISKPYRYIVELNPYHKFSDKGKIVKHLLKNDKISTDVAKYILG